MRFFPLYSACSPLSFMCHSTLLYPRFPYVSLILCLVVINSSGLDVKRVLRYPSGYPRKITPSSTSPSFARPLTLSDSRRNPRGRPSPKSSPLVVITVVTQNPRERARAMIPLQQMISSSGCAPITMIDGMLSDVHAGPPASTVIVVIIITTNTRRRRSPLTQQFQNENAFIHFFCLLLLNAN